MTASLFQGNKNDDMQPENFESLLLSLGSQNENESLFHSSEYESFTKVRSVAHLNPGFGLLVIFKKIFKLKSRGVLVQ